MKTHRSVLTAMGLLSLSACAVMDPYIRHNRLPKSEQIDACANQELAAGRLRDKELDYACGMLVRMERARSEVAKTRSGLTATLLPIAGIVGYNTARGFNAPTNIALTAGGLAGYSTVTTLAQPDRIRIYDNGLRSTSCAISVYQQAIAAGKPESLNRILLREYLLSATADLAEVRVAFRGDANAVGTIAALGRVIDGMNVSVGGSDPDRVVKAQLLSSVRNTIMEVNAQLTQTLPTNSDAFGAAVDSLQAYQDTTRQDTAGASTLVTTLLSSLGNSISGLALAQDQSRGKASLTALYNRMVLIFGLFQAVQDEKPEMTTVSFADCKYASIDDVGTQMPTARLMLGAGDSINNTTIELKANEKRGGIRIYGGLPPYDQGVKGPEPQLSATIEGENGVSNLTLVAPDPNTSEDRIYDVTVTDAAGRYTKVLHVKVPKSSPLPVPGK